MKSDQEGGQKPCSRSSAIKTEIDDAITILLMEEIEILELLVSHCSNKKANSQIMRVSIWLSKCMLNRGYTYTA